MADLQAGPLRIRLQVVRHLRMVSSSSSPTAARTGQLPRRPAMRARFALMMGAAGLALGIVTTAVLEWRLESAALDAQRHALQAAANEVGGRLAGDLQARKREVMLAADLLEKAGLAGPAETRALLDALRNGQPSYAWIGLTDGRGRVLAATPRLLEGADVSGPAVVRAGAGWCHPGGSARGEVARRLPQKGDRQ